MAFLNSIKKGLLISSISLCVIGYFLITKGQDSIDVGVRILSYILMFAGAFETIRYFVFKVDERYKRNDFVFGLLLLVMGITLLIFEVKVSSMAETILGIVMFISAIYKIQDSIDSKKINKSHFGIYVTLAIICIAFGVLIILNPFKGSTLYIVIGIGLLFAGASDFISNIYLAIANAMKLKKENTEVIQEEKVVDENHEDHDESHMTRIDL